MTSWRVDETYINIRGKWNYLYRAVDKHGAVFSQLFGGGAGWIMSRVGEPYTIASAVRLDDAACGLIGLMSCPVSLELQKNLHPRGHVSSVCLHATQGEVVTNWGQSAAGIRHHVDCIICRRATRLKSDPKTTHCSHPQQNTLA